MSKVILVTGATSGIGLLTARMLAEQGHTVIGTGRSADSKGLESFEWKRLDITDQDAVDECVNQIVKTKGKIDVLVNCAGYGLGGGIEDTTAEEARDQFETNFFGAHRVIRAVMPVMRGQGGGMILTVSSVASEFVVPFQSFYSTSKMALDGMMQAVRMEGKPFNIQAACINPGDVRSGFTAARKQAVGCQPGSAYYAPTMKSIETMKRDEMNGMDPVRVAQVVCRLVEKRRLKTKYFIEPQYKAIMGLKRILPTATVEWLMTKIYL